MTLAHLQLSLLVHRDTVTDATSQRRPPAPTSPLQRLLEGVALGGAARGGAAVVQELRAERLLHEEQIGAASVAALA